MGPRRRALSVVAAVCVVVPACARSEADPKPHARPDIQLVADSELTPGHVARGENFGSLLRNQGIDDEQREAILASLEGVFDPRRMHEGQAWRVDRAASGEVKLLEYEIDGRSVLRVTPTVERPGEFAAEVVPYDVHVTRAIVRGEINHETSSLFAAMESAGETADLSVELADIFSGEVDFNNDLQPGDRFELLTERAVRDGRLVGYGSITAAVLSNDGRHLQAFRFQPAGAPPGYYDAEGRSLKRFFLRSPLKFDPRITSGFSTSRFHPILHISRAHLGVDYAAPTGAPVVAVSAGVVTFAAFTNGGGRTVRLRHASGYESGYLHLSAFGPGIHVGAHVSQGQLIGRVGMTGLATGPHLHYELRKNGAVVNPQIEHKKLPPGEPIPASQMDAFRAARDTALASLGGSALSAAATLASR
jgi:murein DD-endopeptidase MepM/ murein hydrolase activator NlpD